MGPNTHPTEWDLADDDFDTAMGPATSRDIENTTADVQLDDAGQPPEAAPGKAYEEAHGGRPEFARDRQVKPNKIYIGGLPDHTRPEDLRNCFEKIGKIVVIELKLGYGFVEFDTKESAEASVARYNDGYFMGNKIRVELSHSRGRSFKRAEDPGACFRCGESGHWARECPRLNDQSHGGASYDSTSYDRGHSGRDYHQSRDNHSYREDHSRHEKSKEDRYYDTSAAAPQPREHRRAGTPPRERRETTSRREYDDYRMRSPPPQQAAARYDRSAHHGSEREHPSNGASHRETYDRYDRRQPYADDRGASYSSHGGRPRTPPGPPPPSGRDDHDKHDKPSRGNFQAHESRRRAATPPPPYPGNSANGSRSRRRSMSPPPRYDTRETRYAGPSHSDNDRYSGPQREGTRVRDYHRSSRAEEYSHRRS